MPIALDIKALRALQGGARDPEGRAFAPLAEALRRAGRLEEAADVAEAGTRALPDFASGHLVRARVLHDLERWDEAGAGFDRVLALDPENARALEGATRVAAREDRAAAEGLALRWRAVEPWRAADVDAALAEAVTAVPTGAADASGAPEAAAALPTGAPEHGEPTPPEGGPADPSGTAPAFGVLLAPEADAEPVDEDEHLPGASGGEELITRTMAELLVAQGLRLEAIALFRKLLERAPDSPALAARLAELEGRTQEPASDTVPAAPPATAEASRPPGDPTPDEGSVPAPEGPGEVEAPTPEAGLPVAALAPTVVPMADLAPDAVPLASLAPETVTIEALSPDAVPVGDLAPPTRPIRELAPDRNAEEEDEEFRRWLEGLQA